MYREVDNRGSRVRMVHGAWTMRGLTKNMTDLIAQKQNRIPRRIWVQHVVRSGVVGVYGHGFGERSLQSLCRFQMHAESRDKDLHGKTPSVLDLSQNMEGSTSAW